MQIQITITSLLIDIVLIRKIQAQVTYCVSHLSDVTFSGAYQGGAVR